MRLAVISDIHSNLEALQEVLADIDRSSIDAVVSLGDNIGYGPDPERVLKILVLRGIPTVMGNHELGIADPTFRPWFNPPTRISLAITKTLLSPASIELIRTLPHSRVFHGSLCVHGCPPESVSTYLFELSNEALARVFLQMEPRICWVGHTHELVLITFNGHDVQRQKLREGTVTLPEGCKFIVNAGSVGQPRDGNNNAKYVVWDDSTSQLQIRYVPYDFKKTARKILDLGFPRINAERLF